ncbi:hypothetical protein SporoP37_13655 [Sporosarcina sp. P37]|nr:hypothetical protein SporoP37_13655 [Sporosarcina sp. P37]
MLKAAIAYANELQWHVFPVHYLVNGRCSCGKGGCTNIAKHPIPRNGFYSATTSIDQIKKWWVKHPMANIGVRTGKESNIFVLDVDIKQCDGRLTLDELVNKYGNLPNTVQSITGSQGLHYVFNYQEGIESKVNFYPGLDIRGDGGYIIVPPSQHKSERRYIWELSSHPLRTEITEAPKWLVKMLIENKSGRRTKKHSSSYWSNLARGVAEGEGRNNAAAILSGHLFRRYVDPLLITELLNLWNQQNRPPLTQEELYKTINSIAGIELARRRGSK